MGLSNLHPADCAEFEYANHPDRRTVLPARVADVLVRLRTQQLDCRRAASDTRPLHRLLFDALTPRDHAYYAGHYRGEHFRCLEHYRVCIESDPRVGFPPQTVPGHMAELQGVIQASIDSLDAGHGDPRTANSKGERLYFTVAVACRIFEVFNRIHPYANGNGHAARLCIWAILGRYGYWPERWPVEPRPPDPPYTALLVAYRNGDREPLERYVLECIAS